MLVIAPLIIMGSISKFSIYFLFTVISLIAQARDVEPERPKRYPTVNEVCENAYFEVTDFCQTLHRVEQELKHVDKEFKTKHLKTYAALQLGLLLVNRRLTFKANGMRYDIHPDKIAVTFLYDF
jgi:hypothetical protein